MRLRIEQAIRAIPRGKVSTYGGVAKAAGYPGAARQVVATLRRGFGLPWQRVLGSGGQIKLTGDSAIEQRLRLEAEGVHFRGRKVDMKQCEWKFRKGGRQTAGGPTPRLQKHRWKISHNDDSPWPCLTYGHSRCFRCQVMKDRQSTSRPRCHFAQSSDPSVSP